MGIVCHLAYSPEDCVYRADRYITVIRPTFFVVVRMTKLVARMALCVMWWCRRSEVRVRGPARTGRESLATFPKIKKKSTANEKDAKREIYIKEWNNQ